MSALTPSPIPLSTTHTRYVPPHPQRGTPYHRYVILLVPQSHPTERISVPVPTEAERVGFDYRVFAEKYGLDASQGGGAHMWREIWDETVSKIYQDVLSKAPPVLFMALLTTCVQKPRSPPLLGCRRSILMLSSSRTKNTFRISSLLTLIVTSVIIYSFQGNITHG